MDSPTTQNIVADKRLEYLADLLDNRFRIPGTQIRFGLDSIIGLVPYAGDIAGFLVAGFMLLIMVSRGAGPVLLLKMIGNYTLDAVVGMVPVLGDVFDIGFKANRRNVNLLNQYYAEERNPPRAFGSFLLLFGIFGFILLAITVLGFYLVSLAFSAIYHEVLQWPLN